MPPPDVSLEAAALLAQVQEAQARVARVQGEARVQVESGKGSGTVSQFLAAERPDRLHVEVLDFFGNVAAVLAARDGRFALYDAKEKVYYRGAATPENLGRLVPLALSADDLVAILCGTAPLLDGRPVRAEPGRGVVELTLARGDVTQTLGVGSAAAVERSALRVGGAPAEGTYDLAFKLFRERGPGWFPYEVALSAASPKVKLALRWREVEVNGEVDPALFTLAPPKGARVVELADEDVPPNLFAPGAP